MTSGHDTDSLTQHWLCSAHTDHWSAHTHHWSVGPDVVVTHVVLLAAAVAVHADLTECVLTSDNRQTDRHIHSDRRDTITCVYHTLYVELTADAKTRFTQCSCGVDVVYLNEELGIFQQSQSRVSVCVLTDWHYQL